MDIENTNAPTDILIYPRVEQFLKNIIAKEGYKSYKIDKRRICTNGGNFLGDLYEIDINGETEDGSKETYIFIKQKISHEHFKDILDVNTCYLNEMFVYTELANIFDNLQKSADVPEKGKFKMAKRYPECNVNAIILQNLNKEGFKTKDRMDVMSLKFAKLAITQLAKFHGLSFVLKHKRGVHFESKIKKMSLPFSFEESWKGHVQVQINNCKKYFSSDMQMKIDDFEKIFFEKFPNYYFGKTNSIKCLCHGDFKINNVMVKEKDEEAKEVVIVDYQLVFYGSPVTDILYFLFTGTDREFRNAHMDSLKNHYHNELAAFLNYFGLDINNVYSSNNFEKDFDDALDFGLMISFYILPLILAREQDIPDFTKNDLKGVTIKPHDKFHQRIKEIVEEYINWGILK